MPLAAVHGTESLRQIIPRTLVGLTYLFTGERKRERKVGNFKCSLLPVV
uniref:Uncharacterized protein n=1 Tax=Anguilla anguilla TaxID=7936 RepID=A0A0E9V9K2_ANGAN